MAKNQDQEAKDREQVEMAAKSIMIQPFQMQDSKSEGDARKKRSKRTKKEAAMRKRT